MLEYRDPFKLARLLWPDRNFYSKEREIVMSVWDNRTTVVPAAHKMGKDFTAGFICVVFPLTRHPVRVVNSSVDGPQLEGVLWGEMRNWAQTSRIPLDAERGGPFVMNHMHWRKLWCGELCGLSYVKGRVAQLGEGMSGHHIAKTGDGVPRTLAVADECSGMDKVTLAKMDEWMDRKLLIGNCYECDNEFKWAVEGKPGTEDRGGDIPDEDRPGKYIRKIIRIEALDSPNVQLGLAEKAAGLKPSNRIVVPGVLPYEDYVVACKTWDPVKQSIGLGARFWKGKEVKLYPTTWLDRAERLHEIRKSKKRRQGKALGCDSAEGGDNTCIVVVDAYGVVEWLSLKTPNTAQVVREVKAMMRRHGISDEFVAFDAGGGGKQHAQRMQEEGYQVRFVAFGGRPAETPGVGIGRGTYTTRRSQMYGDLRDLLDPQYNYDGFAIPREFGELRLQMEPIPLLYDGEGRLLIPSKRKAKRGQPSLVELIGHSPDELDATALAVHAMLHEGNAVYDEAGEL